MSGMGLRAALVAAAAIAASTLSYTAFAQDYPSRPIRVLVPAQAGGIGDILPRIVGQKLAEAGTTLIVENRTGGAGVIAAEAVAKAPPDGYLLLMGNQGQLSIRPLLVKLPYDAAKDFAAVSLLGTSPYLLSVHPSRENDLLTKHHIQFSPPVMARHGRDAFGNVWTRLVAPAGRLDVRNDFIIQDNGLPDEVAPDARQWDVNDLPDDVVPFLYGSRYCDTQKLSNLAWSLFGPIAGGWSASCSPRACCWPDAGASSVSPSVLQAFAVCSCSCPATFRA